MDDDGTPYREFSPNEHDTHINEESPSEVQNDDPHTPSRSEAPGSFPGRMLSAVASGFTGLMRSSAPAAKRVGDQGESRGVFDNTPVLLSASATPMMSEAEREGTPGAAGFLGASDETPAPSTYGDGQGVAQLEHTGNAAPRAKRWREGFSLDGAPADAGMPKVTATEGDPAPTALIGSDGSAKVTFPVGDREPSAAGDRESREEMMARGDKTGRGEVCAVPNPSATATATAAAFRSALPVESLRAPDSAMSALGQGGDQFAWRVDAARQEGCALSVAARSSSRRSVSPPCDEPAASFDGAKGVVPFNSISGTTGPVAVSGAAPSANRMGGAGDGPKDVAPFNSISGTTGPVAVSGAAPLANRMSEVSDGPKDVAPFNSISGTTGPVAVSGAAPAANQGGVAVAEGQEAADLSMANVDAAEQQYLHALVNNVREPGSRARIAKLMAPSSAGSVSSARSARSNSRNVSERESRPVSDRGHLSQRSGGEQLPHVNMVRGPEPSAVERQSAIDAAGAGKAEFTGLDLAGGLDHALASNNHAASVRRVARLPDEVIDISAATPRALGLPGQMPSSAADLGRASRGRHPPRPRVLDADEQIEAALWAAQGSHHQYWAAALEASGPESSWANVQLDNAGIYAAWAQANPLHARVIDEYGDEGYGEVEFRERVPPCRRGSGADPSFGPPRGGEVSGAAHVLHPGGAFRSFGGGMHGVGGGAGGAPPPGPPSSSGSDTPHSNSGGHGGGGPPDGRRPYGGDRGDARKRKGDGAAPPDGGDGGGPPPDPPSSSGSGATNGNGGGHGGGGPPDGRRPHGDGGDDRGDTRKRKGDGAAPPDGGDGDGPHGVIDDVAEVLPKVPARSFDMSDITDLLQAIVGARGEGEAKAAGAEVPKLLRKVPTKLYPHSFLEAPSHLVLRTMESCVLSQDDIRGSLPTTVDGLTRAIDTVSAPTKLLSQFHTMRPLLLREYLDARRNLCRRLVAAVCICLTFKEAEREAARYLYNAVVAVAAVRSGHNTYAGWVHLRRVRDHFESQSPPSSCLALIAAFDTVHAPSTPHAAEEMYRHALDPFQMQDADSLPSTVYAAAVANAQARNSSKDIYVQDARVQFNIWLDSQIKSSPEMRQILQPVSLLFNDVRMLESSQIEFTKQLQFAERSNGEMHASLSAVFAKHVGKQPVPLQRPRAMGHVNQVGQVVQQVSLDHGDDLDSLMGYGVCEYQHVQQGHPSSGDHETDVLNAIEVLEQADRAQSQREASASYNREAPPTRRVRNPFVGAVGEGRRDSAQLQPNDHSRQQYVPQGKQVFSAAWVRDHGCPTLLGEPNERQRLPLGNPNLRQVYRELGLKIPSTFKDDATIGGDMCACCLARGVLRWFIHPQDQSYNGVPKPNEPDCGYVHNIRKCQYLYAAIHIYNRALVDQGKPTADWMCEPRPLPAFAAPRG